MNDHQQDVRSGQRFEFGRNWSRFLRLLNEERIRGAEDELRRMLGRDDLSGLKFLDIGSGSGLMSLAARRLGAEVTSFDYDPQSVACTTELKRRFFAEDPKWSVGSGSVLDAAYMASLGQFDVVYSWGVLHHTGKMWEAIENALARVGENGLFFIAIYNDQGFASRYWTGVKKLYNRNRLLRMGVIAAHVPNVYLARLGARLVTGRLKVERGMSLWYDMLDWLGGYPFEVAKPEVIHDFLHKRGFALERLKTCGGRYGCNEFVFRRVGA